MEATKREPPPEDRREGVCDDDGGCGDAGGDYHRLGAEAADQGRNGEHGNDDAERLHGGVVADDVSAGAARLHDQRQEREHQTEGETEDGDGGDGGDKIDDALPIHGVPPARDVRR